MRNQSRLVPCVISAPSYQSLASKVGYRRFVALRLVAVPHLDPVQKPKRGADIQDQRFSRGLGDYLRIYWRAGRVPRFQTSTVVCIAGGIYHACVVSVRGIVNDGLYFKPHLSVAINSLLSTFLAKFTLSHLLRIYTLACNTIIRDNICDAYRVSFSFLNDWCK